MSETTKKTVFKKGAGWLARRLLILLLAAGLLYGGFRFFKARLDKARLELLGGVASQGEIDLTPDDTMGYNEIEFQEAVLGEATRKKELVVLEREVKTDTVISNALANIEMFRKSKTIHTYGTGVYTVDLAALQAADIAMDEAAGTITVRIPPASLKYVTIDPKKTEVEEIDRSTFLAFGDIKLTPEQQRVVDQEISDALSAELGRRENLLLADEAAEQSVAEIFSPVVTAVSAEFTVRVALPPRPAESEATEAPALDSVPKT